MIQKNIEAINLSTDFESIGSDVQKVLEMLEKISGTFEEIFKQELPEFLRKKYIETTKELQKSTLSLGLRCAGIIPYVSNIASTISLAQLSRELFVNLNQYLRSKKNLVITTYT